MSFMCSLFFQILYIYIYIYIWQFSSVFKCFPVFSIFTTFIVSVILPYACPVFNMWFEHLELPLSFMIACLCSLYLVWNVRPVCPVYFSGQSIHLIWYMSLFSYLSICGWGFTMFCIVFLVRNAFIWASLERFEIFFLSLPVYAKKVVYTKWNVWIAHWKTEQTGRTFHTRYKEHIQAIRNDNGNSAYSNHILNTGHAYGSITDTMKVIKIEKTGKHLNTLEKYHIYKISKNRLHMNDTHILTSITWYLKYYKN
jgi:hypothetical protein